MRNSKPIKLAAAILAGGKNSRMNGQDKAFLKVDGGAIIKRTIDLLRKMFDEVIIATNNPEKYSFYEGDCVVVKDIIRDKGPLCGIHSALTRTSLNGIFTVACDMPYLNSNLIQKIVDESKTDVDCVIPYTKNGLEPLCGIYFKSALPKLEDALSSDDLSMGGFVSRVNCRYVDAGGDDADTFININTPLDMKDMIKNVHANNKN